MFQRLGVPVYDADAAVHALYAKGGAAVEQIGAAFPGTVSDGAVDRQALSRAVLGLPEEMKKLEAIVHPLVGEAQLSFLKKAQSENHSAVLLDIPLLYETGGEARVDVVVVVSAPFHIQEQRVLARPGMDTAKFAAIHAKQVPDAVKRERADFVIDTDKGLDHAFEAVKSVVEALKGREGKVLKARLA
jgi:dephospho-CoA kinase